MRYAENGGICLRYEVRGAGAPLVLAHGFSADLEAFRENGWLAELEGRFRTITVDLRGHGGSSKPHDPDAYGTADRAGDIVAVLDDLGLERAHFLGVSLGGWTGLCVVVHAPERLRTLAVGGATALGQSMEPYRRAMAAGLPAWLAILEQSAGALPDAARLRILANDRDALAASVARDRPPVKDAMRRLPAPVLFFAGSRDPLLPAVVESARETPGAVLVELADLDHVETCVRPAILPAYFAFVAQERPTHTGPVRAGSRT